MNSWRNMLDDDNHEEVLRQTYQFLTAKPSPTPLISNELTTALLKATRAYLQHDNPDCTHKDFAQKLKFTLLCRTKADRELALGFQKELENLSNDESLKLVFSAITNGKLSTHTLASRYRKVLSKHFKVDNHPDAVARAICAHYGMSRSEVNWHLERFVQRTMPSAYTGMGATGINPDFITGELESIARRLMKATMQERAFIPS